MTDDARKLAGNVRRLLHAVCTVDRDETGESHTIGESFECRWLSPGTVVVYIDGNGETKTLEGCVMHVQSPTPGGRPLHIFRVEKGGRVSAVVVGVVDVIGGIG